MFIDRLPRGLDRGAEIGIADHAFREQVHLATEQIFQRVGKIQKRIRVTGVARPRELHDEIQVAVFRLKPAARRRAKQIQPPNLMPLAQVRDALLLLFDQRNHVKRVVCQCEIGKCRCEVMASQNHLRRC